MRLQFHFLFGLWALSASASSPSAQWLSDFKKEAAKLGISKVTLQQLDHVQLIPKVIELDRKQPERTMTFEQYLAKVVKPERIAEGRRLLALHREDIENASNLYGVEPEFITALWGIETHFGARMGDFPIISALMTLSIDGRRPQFFRGQLIEALRIVDRGDISMDNMKGSWAGAMGHCQFMPSTFSQYAVDMDKDGRRDLWGSLPDVFGSAAHYLSKVGWKRGRGWGEPVQWPEGLEESLLGKNVTKTRDEWRKLGLKTLAGELIQGGEGPASVVRPGGNSQKLFLVEGNYGVLLRWNKSEYFATVVGILASHLKRTDTALPQN